MDGTEVDVLALTDGEVALTSGVTHGEILLAFADAMVGNDDAALADARHVVAQALGLEGMVDAAGVASNFERMVRIADSTGIPLDDRLALLTQDVRDELQLHRFATSKELA